MRTRTNVRLGAGTLAVLVWLVAPIPAFAQAVQVLGSVTDQAGEPVKGATIHVASAQDLKELLTASSDGNGRLSFLVPRPGQWDFIVEAPGFGAAAGSVRVRLAPPRPIVIEVVLERRDAPGLSGTLAGQNPASISTQLAAAEALFAGGRYDEAIAAYRSVRVRTPALSAVGLQLGNAYLQKKDYERAEAEFEAVLKSGAANAAACYDLGDVKAARGLSGEAAAWYQKAAAADPLWPRPLMGLAVLAQNTGDREAALGYLKKVIALGPDSPDAARAAVLLGQLGRVN
jgi:tetratricopeptide (TPR) repeat protein